MQNSGVLYVHEQRGREVSYKEATYACCPHFRGSFFLIILNKKYEIDYVKCEQKFNSIPKKLSDESSLPE